VIEAADLMLRWEMIKEVGEVGPGLISTSPERRRIRQSRKDLGLFGHRRTEVGKPLRRKWIGM